MKKMVLNTNLFDFDGTLVGSMPSYISVMLRILDGNLNAVTTAKRAGLKICGVYDLSSFEYEDQIKKTADYYIKDFSKLKQRSD